MEKHEFASTIQSAAMKAAWLSLFFVLVMAVVYGGDLPSPAVEPTADLVSGTWEPAQVALGRLQKSDAPPRRRELVLRRDGTFLIQGIPVQWTAATPGKMPAGRYDGGGKWRWLRDGEKWELLLQIANVSLGVHLRGGPSSYEIVIPSADAAGSFETVVRRSSSNE